MKIMHADDDQDGFDYDKRSTMGIKSSATTDTLARKRSISIENKCGINPYCAYEKEEEIQASHLATLREI